MSPRRHEDKTRDQLLNELVVLRQRITKLKTSEIECKQAQEALRGSEEKYRELVDHMEEGYMIVRGSRIMFANRRCAEVLGIPAEKLIGKNYWKLISREDQEKVKQIYDTVTGGGKAPQFEEFAHPGKDGHGIPLEVSLREVIYEDKPSYAVVLRDITERKRVERVLKESERELSQIIEGTSIPTFVINKEHKITHWNKACENLTGISAGEAIGTKKQWLPFYYEYEERPVMADLVVDNAPEGEIASYYRGKYENSTLIEGAYEAEDFFPHFGEVGKWLFFTAAPLRDHEGCTIGAIETLQDITERKQAEEALKHSERRYRELFDSASEAIIIRDLEGNISEVNQAMSELTGYTVDELARMNIRQFLTPESFDIAMEKQQRQIEGETIRQRFELEIIKRDGANAIVEAMISLITENEQPVTVQAMVRDVTEQKRLKENMQFYIAEITKAQEEERKRIARELHDDTAQVLSSLSREVDNFIRKKTSLLPGEVAFLRYLREELNTSLQCIHRFSQDLRPPILDDLGLLPALRSLANEVKEYDRIDLELRVLGSERRFTPEVELLIFRIVQEALSNIRRHAEASRAWVVIEFAEGKTRLTISDNGQGFELPGRVDDLPRSGKLGLAGMQERARLIGGTLTLQSELGVGTKVVVEVPA